MKNRNWLFASSCVLAMGAALPAAAQTNEVSTADDGEVADQSGLNTIVVTAQKRDQNLQDVGLSVTAVSGEDITSRNISNSIELIRSTPSIDNYSTYGPGSNANVVVRGVGLNDFGEGHEAPVTVYVDEVYMLSVATVDFALFDLERAEVLRGPQGTLFGRNSTGGLIHYVTRKPQNYVEGYAKVSFARFDELKFEGAVSAPLSDTLSGRLSFVSHHSDGYIRNLNPDFSENGAQAGTDAVRAQLRYENDGWDAVLKVEYGQQDRVHTYYESIPTVVDPVTGLASLNPTGVDGAGYNEANFGAGDRNVTFTNAPQFLKSEGLLVSLRVDKDISDSVTFTSVSAFADLSRELAEDCDASPNDICSANFPYQGETLTQEFRFTGDGDRVRWQAGLYGLYAKGQNNPSAIFNAPSSPLDVDPVTGLFNGGVFPLSLAANWRLKTYSGSIFGQVEYDLTDSLTVIAGARVTHDSKDFDDSDNASLRSCPGFPIPTNCFLAPDGPGIANPFSGDYDQTLYSGRLQLNYTPIDDLLFFASVSRGTKAGGFNNGFLGGGVQPSQIPYDDETLLAFEIGQKATFADGRIRLNSSAFYYDYDDFQTFNWEGIGGLIVNRDARNYGAEIELEAAPIDNLTFRVAGSYLDTKIKDVDLPSGLVADREAANAPKWTANGGIDYALPLNEDDSELRFNWNWNYRSSRFANNFNDPSVLLEGYFQHNADITYQVNDSFYVQGFVRNISNVIPTTKAFQFSFLGYAQVIYSEPRVFGAAVGINF